MATTVTLAQEIITCELCDKPTQKFCNNCQVSLCEDCTNKHVIQNESLTHDIVAYKNRIAHPVFPECEFHPNQKCEASCLQCDVLVCMKCVISSHNGHNFGDIPHAFHAKRIEIEKETHEIQSAINLNLKKKEKDIETSIIISKERFDELKEECEQEKQSWHKEVDTVFNKLSSLIESVRNNHIATLKSHLSKLQNLNTDMISTTEQNKAILKSNKVSDVMEHKSKMQKYLNIPTDVVMKIPSIKTLKEQDKLMIELGDYRATLTQTVLSLSERLSGVTLKESLAGAKLFDTIPLQKAEDSAHIERLRLSLKRYKDELTTERREHQNTKNAMGELKQSFHQLVSEHNNLSEKYESVKSQGWCTETEKQTLLDQIGRLTAQVYSGEEAIFYREEKLNKLEAENKKITEELNNVIPVLKAQAEVWKSDFDAERDARERLHAEKTQLENDYKQLQLRNQQLLDAMENFSKRQFQEMQQRHSSQGFQQSLQQHLRVGHQNRGSPYQFPQYPPQGYPSQAASGAGGMYSDGRAPPNVPTSQGEILKSNFHAKRDAREHLHEEKSQMENDFKQLQLSNQHLPEEQENFTTVFQKIQHGHFIKDKQHSNEQHLRVGSEPIQPISAPSTMSPISIQRGKRRLQRLSAHPAVPTSQIHSQSQEVEKPHQIECPKCNQICTGMYSIQRHLRDCCYSSNKFPST